MHTILQGDHHSLLPESILPEQFATLWRRRVVQPEQVLLRAVLEQAARDLRRFRGARCRAAQRLYLDAYNWVCSLDRSYWFSFINVCEVLGLSPPAVRARFLGEQSTARRREDGLSEARGAR